MNNDANRAGVWGRPLEGGNALPAIADLHQQFVETQPQDTKAQNKMDDKQYLTAQELLNDSFELGLRIYKSGFRPSFIIGIWRGGTPVGIAVQEILDHLGIKTDHIAIRTSSYYGIDKRDKKVRVHGLEYVVQNANWEDGLLIVDDVFDSGSSIKAVIEALKKKDAPQFTR